MSTPFQNVDRKPDIEVIRKLADEFMNLVRPRLDVDEVLMPEVLYALINAAASIVAQNVDPDQRARLVLSVQGSFPELVRKTSLAYQTPNIQQPQGRA